MLEGASLMHGPVEGLLERGPIFGVNPLYEFRIGRRCRRIEGKDAEMLCGPGELAGADVPAPAAGVADLLPIGERGVAPPNRRFYPPALGQVEHEGDVLVPTPLKGRGADQHRHTAAVFPEVFLFERVAAP